MRLIERPMTKDDMQAIYLQLFLCSLSCMSYEHTYLQMKSFQQLDLQL